MASVTSMSTSWVRWLRAARPGRLLTAQRSGKVVNVASIAGLVSRRASTGVFRLEGRVDQILGVVGPRVVIVQRSSERVAAGGFDTEAQQEVLPTPELVRARVSRIPAESDLAGLRLPDWGHVRYGRW